MNFKHVKKGYIQLDGSVNGLIQFLDVDGNLKDRNYKRPETLSNEKLLKGYKTMILSRKQDEYMSQLQLQGKMLTFAPNFGEEALQVATAMATKKGDWFVPAFRSNAAMLYLGVPLINQLTYWNGNEKGSKMPEGVNVLPINIPIGTQTSHATGIAYGMKLKDKKNVAITFIGNGGTTEGEFFEAMNFAAVHSLPAIFCVNNNQWAISTPSHLETISTSITAKAYAVNIPGLRVDGNDLLASYEVIEEAIEWAREGNGPILIEFLTWRQGKHTTSDDPTIYRSKEMEKENEKWEPFHRIEKYLIDQQIINKNDIEGMKDVALEEVKAAYLKSLENIDETIDEIFDYTYEKLTKELIDQKNQAKEFFKK